MTSFLPDSYSIPDSGGKYMKFQDGENRFRILSSPIIGNEYWNYDNKPVRLRMDEKANLADIRPNKDGTPGSLKHFWAMPAIDRADGQVKVLEITQKGIQKAVKGLAGDADWGSPTSYDLVVKKSGTGMETEYEVVPKPAKALDRTETELFEKVLSEGFNLNALFTGGDPFTAGIEDVTPPAERKQEKIDYVNAEVVGEE